MAKLRDWIDDRTGYRNVLHALLLLNFPVSRAARWRYVWGGSLALMFLVELVTGTLLMTVYSPSEASAWGSVQYLEAEVSWGWLIRGVHHYTSHMMLVVILIHMLAVVFTAGYRRPREFIFWSGLILGGVVLALAVTGNPLPWDQKGYWAYQIETGILGTLPSLGPALRNLLVGGSEFGHLTLTRLYTLHVVVLPVVATLILVLHVALVRRDKLKLYNILGGSGADSAIDWEPYWPFQTTRNLLLFGLLMGIVVTQTVWYPKIKERRYAAASVTTAKPEDAPRSIAIEAPADRNFPYVARPEWYVRVLYELRTRVRSDREVLVTAALPLAIVLLLFLMPLYEYVLGKRLGHGLAVALIIGGYGAAAYFTYQGLAGDQHDSEFIQARRRDLAYATRAAQLAHRNGIPPEGPAALLQNDPIAMGPLLFAAHCSSCHTYHGHDGTGAPVMEVVDGRKVKATPSASDLYRFASTDWIAGLLTKPDADNYFGHTDRIKRGDEIKNGEMATWAASNLVPEGKLRDQEVRAVAALLAREAARKDDPAADEETLSLGVALFAGTLEEIDGEPLDEFDNCLQCHELKSGDPDEYGSDGAAPAPNLNGYGSSRWLRAFIRHPGADVFYGEKNVMPAFDESQLPDRDLALLVNWLRGDTE